MVAQVSARHIHCWDLNENGECDIETEDMNFDGKCNGRDCKEQCYAVPQTGQTLCYDAAGNTIDCVGTGQDGEYQFGTPWPEPRFTDNLDGTVTDHLTGLIWLKDADCFEQKKKWQDALSACNDLAHGQCELSDGSSPGDWRLPNIREFLSLIDFGSRDPALPLGHPFMPPTGGYDPYWTSTSYDLNTTEAWAVSLGYGEVIPLSKIFDSCQFWPVRGPE